MAYKAEMKMAGILNRKIKLICLQPYMKKNLYQHKSYIKERIEETLELLAILVLIFIIIAGFFISGYFIFN